MAVVVAGGICQHAVHQHFGTAEGDPQALAGERVDVSRGIANEHHPARRLAFHPLPQWTRGPIGAMRRFSKASCQGGKFAEVVVESALA